MEKSADEVRKQLFEFLEKKSQAMAAAAAAATSTSPRGAAGEHHMKQHQQPPQQSRDVVTREYRETTFPSVTRQLLFPLSQLPPSSSPGISSSQTSVSGSATASKPVPSGSAKPAAEAVVQAMDERWGVQNHARGSERGEEGRDASGRGESEAKEEGGETRESSGIARKAEDRRVKARESESEDGSTSAARVAADGNKDIGREGSRAGEAEGSALAVKGVGFCTEGGTGDSKDEGGKEGTLQQEAKRLTDTTAGGLETGSSEVPPSSPAPKPHHTIPPPSIPRPTIPPLLSSPQTLPGSSTTTTTDAQPIALPAVILLPDRDPPPRGRMVAAVAPLLDDFVSSRRSVLLRLSSVFLGGSSSLTSSAPLPMPRSSSTSSGGGGSSSSAPGVSAGAGASSAGEGSKEEQAAQQRVAVVTASLEEANFWPLAHRLDLAHALINRLDAANPPPHLAHCGGEFATPQELAAHAVECPFRAVSCSHPGCDETVSWLRLREHDEGCAHKVLACRQGCGQGVARAVMEWHCNGECPQKVRIRVLWLPYNVIYGTSGLGCRGLGCLLLDVW